MDIILHTLLYTNPLILKKLTARFERIDFIQSEDDATAVCGEGDDYDYDTMDAYNGVLSYLEKHFMPILEEIAKYH